ncbi:MAG: Type 1 glutamine amidotransferase-like domain-containing protein [Candidatus Delongbacteria bacterium]|jgi:dipeptidase E|nr:Type 1 glutamine amidotransferase-like domain-containing protein [Candidatus Delongbacteria bacterium]
MRFYLSSFKIGKEILRLKELINLKKKVAYIPNAVDHVKYDNQSDSMEESGLYLQNELGLDVEFLDLKDYFQNTEALKRKIQEYGTFWVRGGNVFILRRAMKLSGFDDLLTGLVKDENLVYGGYSAGCCVLSPHLNGFELVDDKDINPYSNKSNTIWEGLNILDYSFIPHFESNHPESDRIANVVKYCIENEIPHRKFKDGEVCVM